MEEKYELTKICEGSFADVRDEHEYIVTTINYRANRVAKKTWNRLRHKGLLPDVVNLVRNKS